MIPIKRNGFFLQKQAFKDAIRIRYNIPLERLSTLCVCGNSFNLQHALSCPKGGLVITRHNELRNLTAEILGEVCKNVVIEPLLTPLMGEELPKSSNTCNQARADVSAGELWINGQTAFCDVRVFNPLARCHLHHSLPALQEPKSKISAWIKTRLNFALIGSILLCLRGTKTPSNVDNISKINLCGIVAESNIEWITYRFIPCYFKVINTYSYIFTWSLSRYFLYLYPVIRCLLIFVWC